MSYVQLAGPGPQYPREPCQALIAPAFDSMLIDATGEKAAFVGRVWFVERTSTKAIRKVGFRFGTVTKAGGSGLTVSLQDISLTGGPPMSPDETQDQTVAIANGDASFASNTWYQTGALSADRTVNFGDLLAVVIEYDGSGRLSSDAVNITAIDSAGNIPQLESGASLKTGGTWANQSMLGNVILEFSDGTFGTLSESFPCSAIATQTYNSGSAADEFAMEISFPFPCKVDGGWAWLTPASSSANYDIVLYDGTSAMTNGTVSIDANAIGFASSTIRRMSFEFPGEVTLAANTTYRLAFKPTTANSIVLQYFDVSAAGHFQAHDGGTAFCLTSRVDAGSWAAATTTRRPMCGLRISSLDTGGGSGGGPLIGPGRLVRT